MTSDQQAYCTALADHYETSWGRVEQTHRWTKGPYWDLGPLFSVAQYSAAHDTLAFATIGMSRVDREDPIELHILASKNRHDGDSLVELLTVVAHYHRTGAHLSLHHTVNFGRPWLPGSSCSYGLVSLPHLEEVAFERPAATPARCLWLIPVNEAEVAFKRAQGVEALELAFERHELDYLNPARASVVSSGPLRRMNFDRTPINPRRRRTGPPTFERGTILRHASENVEAASSALNLALRTSCNADLG